jgi:hypothetical protein
MPELIEKRMEKVTVDLPVDMAVELRHRQKRMAKKQPGYSRNMLVRMIFRDYFDRHPMKNGA